MDHDSPLHRTSAGPGDDQFCCGKTLRFGTGRFSSYYKNCKRCKCGRSFMGFTHERSYRLYYLYSKNYCIVMIKKLSDFEKNDFTLDIIYHCTCCTKISLYK